MIRISNLTKKYGENIVLNNISHKFPNSGVSCVLGASGVGKTTLLNILAGFDTDFTGEVVVSGRNIGRFSKAELCEYRKSQIGFVFQNYHLVKGYTVLENILLASEVKGISREENKTKAKKLLQSLGILEKIDEKVENLSGGQKQRVAIARALINEPQIILADEPTGALDRKTTNEIMGILKEISKDRLVIVITHDHKICDFADEVLNIEEGKIVVTKEDMRDTKKLDNTSKTSARIEGRKPNIGKYSFKNFKLHMLRYLFVALSLAIGISAFVMSLSFNEVIKGAINDFQEKNIVLNNGYIPLEKGTDLLDKLLQDDRIENAYYQYDIGGISLEFENKEINFDKYISQPKAPVSFTFGKMAKTGDMQIALSLGLAQKVSSDVQALVGKDLSINYNGYAYPVTISGIYDTKSDHFFVSPDIEQSIYSISNSNRPRSITYDVKNFKDIIEVTDELIEKGFAPETAVEQVKTLTKTFDSMRNLFLVISMFILAIALFISILLISKLSFARYSEVGLLSALGFTQGQISRFLGLENLLLTALSSVLGVLGVFGTGLVFELALGSSVAISTTQIITSVLITFVTVITIGYFFTHKLTSTDPAVAIRK